MTEARRRARREKRQPSTAEGARRRAFSATRAGLSGFAREHAAAQGDVGMIIDKNLMFSDVQAVKATAESTHTVDVGDGDPGASPLELVVLSASDATGDGALVVSLQTCDSATGSFADMVQSRSLKVADLKAGASVLPIRVPRGVKRCLRLKYTVTGTLSATLTAFLTLDRAHP